MGGALIGMVLALLILSSDCLFDYNFVTYCGIGRAFMNHLIDFLCYFFFGMIGGYCGARLKLPAGALMGALLCVVLAKFLLRADWELPKSFDFFLQVAIGVMVAATFHHSMLPTLGRIVLPVFASSFFLIYVFF